MSAESRGILDTSTVVQLGRLPDARNFPAEPLITAVMLAELAVGPLVARRRRANPAAGAPAAGRGSFVALPCDEEAARAFASVAAALRGGGRKVSATHLRRADRGDRDIRRLAVHTCNPDDFGGIDRLEVVAVSVPE